MPDDPHASSLDYATIVVERDGGVDWLTLNRPERFNALNARLCAELQDYFGRLCADHTVRVVILRGAGRHFCAGYDLDELAALTGTPPSAMRTQRGVSEIIMRMRRCPQPIIALVHGAATGGGLALALAADVRYAATDCRMNVAMARIGMTGCDVGISYFLPRAVGASNAAEMMMSGRFVDAEKALRIGLVSLVAAAPDLEVEARGLAADMLEMSPFGLRLTKEGFNAAQDAGSLEAVIALEDRGQMLCAAAGHMEEGVAAFKQKRTPHYGDE
jgi:enoyl-CoA hydratase